MHNNHCPFVSFHSTMFINLHALTFTTDSIYPSLSSVSLIRFLNFDHLFAIFFLQCTRPAPRSRHLFYFEWLLKLVLTIQIDWSGKNKCSTWWEQCTYSQVYLDYLTLKQLSFQTVWQKIHSFALGKKMFKLKFMYNRKVQNIWLLRTGYTFLSLFGMPVFEATF